MIPATHKTDIQMTISELQTTIDNWILTTGRGYFSPLTNMAVLTEETGEVARIMARRYGDQVAKPSDNADLADELADILWVVGAIANQTGVDLTSAVLNNIRKKNIRDKERFSSRDNENK